MEVREDVSGLMHEALKKCGLSFFMSVPCKHLAKLISRLERDQEVKHLPVTREEEGIGIAAGAFLTGKMGVLLMQNSGLGNAVNALASLMAYYKIPMILVVSHRGLPGETIGAQVPMGKITERLLRTLDIPFFRYESLEDLAHMKDHISHAQAEEKPVCLLISPKFWG